MGKMEPFVGGERWRGGSVGGGSTRRQPVVLAVSFYLLENGSLYLEMMFSTTCLA